MPQNPSTPPPLSAQAYSTLRDQLISLIDRGIAIERLDADFRGSLEKIRSRALADRFHIVLAGEFQGGKSTTFNAICGGRALSPMGSGTKTSAALLSAQPISDADTAEWAQVEWKTPEQLIAGFSDLLLPQLRLLAPKRLESADAAQLPHLLNLQNPADRSLIQSAIDAEWQQWEQNRRAYDPQGKGNLEILRCATLILRHYNDPALQNLSRRNRYSLQEIEPLAAFPEEWEIHWIEKGPQAFSDPNVLSLLSVPSVLFLFVAHIRLFIHSQNLRRIGCVLWDCPGLFASRWDTETARRAMLSADAILYIFDGSRPLKGSDLKALDFIRKHRLLNRTFYGCNRRGRTPQEGLRVLDASLDALRARGIQVPRNRTALFDAKKAFESAQKDQENGAGLEKLTEMAETAVIREKARTILIDNGAAILLDGLDRLAGDLLAQEIQARKAEKELREAAASAQAALRRFEADCKLALTPLDDPAPDRILAQALWEELSSEQTPLLKSLTQSIAKEIFNIKDLTRVILRSKTVENRIMDLIRGEIDERFRVRIHAWMNEIEEGRNRVYNREMARRVKTVDAALRRIWAGISSDGPDLLQGISLPVFTGNPALDRERICCGMESEELLSSLRYSAAAAASLTGIMTAASGIAASVTAVVGRLFWAAAASAGVMLVNALLLIAAKGAIKETLQEEIRTRLSPALIRLYAEIEPEVKARFADFFKEIRKSYFTLFQNASHAPARILAHRVEAARAARKTGAEERERSASAARTSRTETVAPLQRDVEAFIRHVRERVPNQWSPSETETPSPRPDPGNTGAGSL